MTFPQTAHTGQDLITANRVRDLEVEGTQVRFTLELPSLNNEYKTQLNFACQEAVLSVFPEANVHVHMMASAPGAQSNTSPLPHVKNIIAVGSGKGGVGKSTVTVNLAVSLAKAGYAVGLVDTDIYGPSIPTMFGVTDAKPRVNSDRKILPVEKAGVKLLSMGFLADPNQAVIWRGPMVSNAIRQFLGDAAWGDLDFLLLDLPPGTGDIQLTIVQTVALTGAIIVSTPQEVALADARRGVAMFQNVNVPVLGIVENMAYFTPPELPDKKYYIFGQGGARHLADELSVPFLGEVPIEQALRESGDAGTPYVESNQQGASADAFATLAQEALTQTALYKAKLPAQDGIEISYR